MDRQNLDPGAVMAQTDRSTKYRIWNLSIGDVVLFVSLPIEWNWYLLLCCRRDLREQASRDTAVRHDRNSPWLLLLPTGVLFVLHTL